MNIDSAIIASLLLEPNGETLPPNLTRLLQHAPTCFDDGRLGKVAVAIRELRSEQIPIHPISVIKRLNRIDFDDPISFVSGLTDALPLALAELEAETVWQNYQKRQTKAVIAESLDSMDRHPDSIPTIVRNTVSTIERLNEENNPDRNIARPWIDIGQTASNDDILIGPGRWITRGAGVLLVAYTGIGKSTWSATQSFSWAIGRESLGMRPERPLKSLVFQAEDDDGDLDSMARSILSDLEPTDEEITQIRQNVLVITESAATGVDFLTSCVAPALQTHSPDLLWINPLSTYFGADLNDQREAALFLRNTLNPLLLKHRCACFLIHHCAKPTQERQSWQGGQLAYIGAGSADLANWAREVISLKESSPGLFEMSLTKRWRKVGWTDTENRPTHTRLIAHDRSGGQVWRDATPSILEELGATPYSDAALLALIPDAGIDRSILLQLIIDTFSTCQRTAIKYLNDARRECRRTIAGHSQRFALLSESSKPRKDVYPDKPQGRPVIWLTKSVSAKELVQS